MLKFRKKIFAADLCIISLFLPILLAVGGGTVIKPVIFIVAIYIFIHQVILYQFTRPIGQIIHAIEKQGKYIPLESIKDPEFNKLASTLNSLTEQIQQQVEHLTTEQIAKKYPAWSYVPGEMRPKFTWSGKERKKKRGGKIHIVREIVMV